MSDSSRKCGAWALSLLATLGLMFAASAHAHDYHFIFLGFPRETPDQGSFRAGYSEIDYQEPKIRRELRLDEFTEPLEYHEYEFAFDFAYAFETKGILRRLVASFGLAFLSSEFQDDDGRLQPKVFRPGYGVEGGGGLTAMLGFGPPGGIEYGLQLGIEMLAATVVFEETPADGFDEAVYARATLPLRSALYTSVPLGDRARFFVTAGPTWVVSREGLHLGGPESDRRRRRYRLSRDENLGFEFSTGFAFRYWSLSGGYSFGTKDGFWIGVNGVFR